MSATAPQSAAKPLPKVLRIGIAQDQKIVQERLMRIGESVTIGENARNSFVVTGTKLPPRYELFVARGETYFLMVPDWVEGKISWKDGIRGLDELRARGDAVKKGDLFQIPLNENVRGKVSIGPTTLLFQFVPAPPEPARAPTAADFRPRLFSDDDPLFQGLLGVFSVIAAAFMVWVYTTPPREHVDLDAIDDALDLVVEHKIEQVVIADEKPIDAPAPKDEAKKPEAKPEDKPAPKSDQPESPPTKESVEKKSMLLQLIGTVGNAQGDDVVNDILGDESAIQGQLDKALNGVNGVQQADATNIAAKSGSAGGRGDAKVGVGVATGGNVSTTGGAAVVVKKAKVDAGDVDADVESGDAGSIGSVVRKSQGLIVTCLEHALKQNPDVNGRVGVGWTIRAGKVTESHLVKNTTGDDALGQCIVGKVRGFRFAEDVTADVAEFPWVVSGQ
jgi:hypothetical protein